jgi:hypothetical protein
MDNRRARRAVSDVVSFTLVFSLIAVTVGVVYVGGLAAVEDKRDAERFDNAVRAFDVLADNLADVHEDGAPSRATEVKLADSGLTYGEPTVVNVTVHNVGDDATQVVSIEPIRYRTNGRDGELVYEAGAVVRTENGGSVFARDPPLLFADDGSRKSALLPIVQTRATDTAGVGGEATILVRAELALRESLDVRTAPANVTQQVGGEDEYNVTLAIETDPTRAQLWRDHLEAEIPDTFEVHAQACQTLDRDGDGAEETVYCTIAVDELFVSASRIDVSFD